LFFRLLNEEAEREDVAADCDGYVLTLINRVSHRRGANALAGIEMPERSASRGFQHLQRAGIIPKKSNPPAVVRVPPPKIALADLQITPQRLAIRNRKR